MAAFIYLLLLVSRCMKINKIVIIDYLNLIKLVNESFNLSLKLFLKATMIPLHLFFDFIT